MKICSLLPSATEILYALGLEDEVVGVTDICDYPPEVKSKHVVCRSLFDPAKLTSAEVDARMQDILKDGGSPFVLDVEWLRREQPDLIIAQDLCYRCSPDASEVARVCDVSGISAEVLKLHPKTIGGIFDSMARVARLTGSEERASCVIRGLRGRIRAVSEKVADVAYRPRVFSVEGVDPLVVGGNWLPEMRALAGGREDPFAPGSPAKRIDWDVVRAAAPEILVIALCSSPMARSMKESEWLRRQEEWSELPAVRNGRVYVVEHVYFSRPGPRVVMGIEILAELLNPVLFSGHIPEGAARAFPTDAISVGQ
jgi:iron complex transport system substrate-binding protein